MCLSSKRYPVSTSKDEAGEDEGEGELMMLIDFLILRHGDRLASIYATGGAILSWRTGLYKDTRRYRSFGVSCGVSVCILIVLLLDATWDMYSYRSVLVWCALFGHSGHCLQHLLPVQEGKTYTHFTKRSLLKCIYLFRSLRT